MPRVCELRTHAERVPGSRDHDDANGIVVVEMSQCFVELSRHLHRPRIALFGAVQPDMQVGARKRRALHATVAAYMGAGARNVRREDPRDRLGLALEQPPAALAPERHLASVEIPQAVESEGLTVTGSPRDLI